MDQLCDYYVYRIWLEGVCRWVGKSHRDRKKVSAHYDKPYFREHRHELTN
jgi:hypothetical protein